MKFKKDTKSSGGAFFSAGGFRFKQFQNDLSIARNRISEGGRVVKTAQGRIEYSTAGKGSPVLFIHGAGGGYAICKRRYRKIHPLNRRQILMQPCLIICISKKPPLLDYLSGVLLLFCLLCDIQTDAQL